MKNPNMSPATIALHSDREFERYNGVAPPINQSVTYFAESADDFATKATEPLNDQFYARHGNPTSSRIAKAIAELEGGESAMMFASGMGAISTTVFTFIQKGAHLIAQKNHYIGTTNLVTELLLKFGVETTLVDQTDPLAFEKAIRKNTTLMIVETPVNPTMQLTDLAAIASLAKSHGIVTICDNTFATPINQKPLSLGIDVVCHSATKYIGGHHDLLAGCTVGSTEILTRVWDTSMTLGALAAPFNAWLALRGIRTLPLRVQQHNQATIAIARFLQNHPKISAVHYPGLKNHPQHDLAERQMSGFGGLLSFVLKDGYEAGVNFLRNTRIIQNAGSLGGVDSLAIQPAAMWSGRLPLEVIRNQGIEPGMIRLASGIEDIDDLIEDIDQALEKLC